MQIRFKLQKLKACPKDVRDNATVETDIPGGDSYLGGVQGGHFQGEGTYTWSNGDMYVGNFLNSEISGKGIYTSDGGDTYEGSFLHSLPSAYGIATYITIADIKSYEGFWLEGLASGKGKLVFDLGDTYEGQFQAGRFHGKGVMTFANGDAYDGLYVNGNPQGDGQFLFKEVNLIQRRNFANGVDRATTQDIKHNTFDIKKKNNVKVKEFKQPQGQKHFHPKTAKKVSNQNFISSLLKGSIKVRAASKIAKRKSNAKPLPKRIVKKTNKARRTELVVKSTVRHAVRVQPSFEYARTYITPRRGAIDQNLSRELQVLTREHPLKRTKSMQDTMEAALTFLSRPRQ